MTAVLGLAHVARRSAPAVRALAAAVAACTWSAVVTAAALQVLLEGPGTGPACVLAAATSSAALVAWWRQRDELRADAGPGGRIGRRRRVGGHRPGLGAARRVVARPRWPGSPPAWSAVGLRAPSRWGAAPAAVAALVGVIASLPLVDATFAALDAALQVASADWALSAATSARGLSHDGSLVAAGPLATHLAALAALVLALAPRIGRRAVELLLGATAGAGGGRRAPAAPARRRRHDPPHRGRRGARRGGRPRAGTPAGPAGGRRRPWPRVSVRWPACGRWPHRS